MNKLSLRHLTTRLPIFLIIHLYVGNVDCNAQLISDIYYQLTRTKIARLERVAGRLESENADLRQKAGDMSQTQANLEQALTELFKNNIKLRNAEAELIEAKKNYVALGDSNQELVRRIDQLENKLAALTANYEIIETELEHLLIENGKLQAVSRAQQNAIQYLINATTTSEYSKRYYASISSGAGTNYSGLGNFISFRYGRDYGIGIRVGGGYLPPVTIAPGIYVHEGLYFNSGLSFYFLENWFVDVTYHIPGYKNDNAIYTKAITLQAGYYYYFEEQPRLGIRLSVGALYTTGLVKSEYLLAGDLGVTYRF